MDRTVGAISVLYAPLGFYQNHVAPRAVRCVGLASAVFVTMGKLISVTWPDMPRKDTSLGEPLSQRVIDLLSVVLYLF